MMRKRQVRQEHQCPERTRGGAYCTKNTRLRFGLVSLTSAFSRSASLRSRFGSCVCFDGLTFLNQQTHCAIDGFRQLGDVEGFSDRIMEALMEERLLIARGQRAAHGYELCAGQFRMA